MWISIQSILKISVVGMIVFLWGSFPSDVQSTEPKSTLPQAWQPPAGKLKEGKWKYIVFHHTAAEQGSVESIDRDHRSRKDSQGNPWLGIGYHFVIGNGHGMEDGQIEPTFRWKEQRSGAHAGNKQYNDEGIGICLIGNFEKKPPTDRQLQACQKLVKHLSQHFDIPQEKFIRHSKIKPTACPGKHFPEIKL